MSGYGSSPKKPLEIDSGSDSDVQVGAAPKIPQTPKTPSAVRKDKKSPLGVAPPASSREADKKKRADIRKKLLRYYKGDKKAMDLALGMSETDFDIKENLDAVKASPLAFGLGDQKKKVTKIKDEPTDSEDEDLRAALHESAQDYEEREKRRAPGYIDQKTAEAIATKVAEAMRREVLATLLDTVFTPPE